MQIGLIPLEISAGRKRMSDWLLFNSKPYKLPWSLGELIYDEINLNSKKFWKSRDHKISKHSKINWELLIELDL